MGDMLDSDGTYDRDGARLIMDETSDVMERYLAAWNAHDGQLIEAVYGQDAVRRSPLGTVRGVEAIRTYAERFWSFAPESRRSAPHWAAQGNVIYFELVYEGIQSGPLTTPRGELGVSGQAFHMEGGGTFEVREGRIVAERVYFDTAEFLRQLGLSL
jgi:limonene-1,2-epoxide hydrolase